MVKGPESFDRNHVYPGLSLRLLPGENINPQRSWEPNKHSLQWINWDTGFKSLNLTGLKYLSTQLGVNYFWYANRGNTANPMEPQISRSHAVISHWEITSDASTRYGLDTNSNRVTSYFPVYDGIGFWEGKRRRDRGISPYTEQEVRQMARISALGALQIDGEGSNPSLGEVIYQCIWVPGKLYSSEGSIIPSVSTDTFLALGFTPVQVMKQAKDGGAELPFKLFGRILEYSEDGTKKLPFNPQLALDLHDGWKYVNSLPFIEDTPPPDNLY